MNVFPIITKEKQKLYEKIYLANPELKNEIPCICGYYGRACRNMDEIANSFLCNGCTLSAFASTVEAILECCDEKEALGITKLYDSDILDIQGKMQEKAVKVDAVYIEKILDILVEEKKEIKL